MENLYAAAYLIARLAHKGQTDKAGVDYFNHPLAVSSYCQSDLGKICGLLHDVLEDTDVTDEELRAIFGDEITDILELLNHEKGTDYFEYLKKVKTNPYALEVKKADLKHNSDPQRLSVLPLETQERLKKKYDLAKAYLNQKEINS